MIVTFTNDFHNTRVNVRVTSDPLKHKLISARTAKRMRAKLCGSRECTCSQAHGVRGAQASGYVLEWCGWDDSGSPRYALRLGEVHL